MTLHVYKCIKSISPFEKDCLYLGMGGLLSYTIYEHSKKENPPRWIINSKVFADHFILYKENYMEEKDINTDIRSYNVGNSDYSKHKIQPWDIWREYNLNPWDADIVKRILRVKEGDSRILDYEKIIHICKERIRQLQEEGS